MPKRPTQETTFTDSSFNMSPIVTLASPPLAASAHQARNRRESLLLFLAISNKARIALAALIFPDFRQDFTVVDDLDRAAPLPDFPAIQGMASNNNPDIRAAQAAIQQQRYELSSARAGFLPTLSFDYFFGINANQFAIRNPEGQNLLGSAAQVQLTANVRALNSDASLGFKPMAPCRPQEN